jgi:hypothetical protein
MAGTPLPTLPVLENSLPDVHHVIVVVHIHGTSMHSIVPAPYRIDNFNIEWFPSATTKTRVGDMVTKQDIHLLHKQDTMLLPLLVPAGCSGNNAIGSTGRDVGLRNYPQQDLWKVWSAR